MLTTSSHHPSVLSHLVLQTSGEKETCLFVLIIRFRQFGAEKTFFSNFFFKVQNHLKREKKLKKIFFFFYPLDIPRIRMKIFVKIRIRNTAK